MMLHIMRAHLQVMLWKAADQREPPAETRDITQFGWEVTRGVVMPTVSTEAMADDKYIYLISSAAVALH